MYILTEISDKLKEILNLKDNKKYLKVLIESLERKTETDENLPFKIKGISKGGFKVKTNGLYAFIPFKYMPWDYPYKHIWELIYPRIKEKIFFGKVLRLKKDPIGIILHAKVPQFKRPDLIENNSYKGILINKSKFGLFVDIGYHFSWNCGSLVGLLHKSNCKDYEKQRKIKLGQEIEVYLWGFSDNNKMIFADNLDLKEWHTGEISELKGKTASVEVIKDEQNRMRFLVEGKYWGTLPINRLMYPGFRKEAEKMINDLNDKDLIECDIVGVNFKNKTLTLKADLSSFPNKLNTLKNNVSTKIVDKLEELKNN
jgi:ribosomal protein S1